MRKLSDTVARLATLRKTSLRNDAPRSDSHLVRLTDFGSNPGNLGGWLHVPDDLAENAPLVVVLHGCTQTAAAYDIGAGWSDMADRHGFAVLFPEQQRQNNPNLCFNWFSPEDTRRGSGETLSIRQMVASVVAGYGIDPARIFVTGLSAGGAMASVLLATYPELFAGGAIIAGLPYGSASTIPQAFDRMRGHGMPVEAELSSLIRKASDHEGPWPTISIWHGSGDATVNPINAPAIIDQWRSLHGVAPAPTRTEAVDGYPRRVWADRAGREVIEEYSITGMGHGTPLATQGDDGCGRSGAYMLEASISSTRHICRFWGLIDAKPEVAQGHPSETTRRPQDLLPALATTEPGARAQGTQPASTPAPAQSSGVAKIIDDALRAAGLLR